MLRRRYRRSRPGPNSLRRFGHHSKNDLIECHASMFQTSFVTIPAQDLVDTSAASVLDATHAPDAALPVDIHEL